MNNYFHGGESWLLLYVFDVQPAKKVKIAFKENSV